MKWYLIWLIITLNPDGTYSAVKSYETYYRTEAVCMEAQEKLDAKLIDEGYKNFTTICEQR